MKFTSLLPIISLATLSACAATPKTVPGPQHGYIDTPPSRAYLCSQHQNNDCVLVGYEPQSVEGPQGFPDGGPADGRIASGGSRFTKLDEYGINRWTKVPVKAGKQVFNWSLTAPHRTAKWEFFITKQNWDPNKPLSRSDFDLTPFCSREDNGAMPSLDVSITCTVPKRTGYQQILGVWTIADTSNAFYQIIDANFPK